MTDGRLGIEDRGAARLLTLDHPPSNALDAALRGALIAALASLPEGCERVILQARGATFSSALPLEPDSAAPGLAEVCQTVETAPVPVVAVLHGLVMGQGAELALAAALRIAAPDARIAVPEIALGLCPEAGTTRRLPRLAGAEVALQLMLSGRAVRAGEALALGLVDAVAEEPLAAALVAEVPPRALSAAALPVATAAAVAAARRQEAQGLPAAGRIIACVEAAALLPPEAHQAFEAVAREDLEASPEAAGLRGAARAERRAATLPAAVARHRPQAAERIAVRGSSGALMRLAQAALARGLGVDWLHPAEGLRDQVRGAGAGRLVVLPEAVVSQAELRIVDAEAPWPGGAGVTLVMGGADDAPGLAVAGRLAELSAPPGTPAEAVALALATLRQIGLSVVLTGHRPALGAELTAAGGTALAQLARSGVAQRHLGAALAGFGALVPPGLPPSEGPPRDMPDEEIVKRWLAAQANAGLRLLDQGVARRPSDIDLVLMQGHGFPRHHCGPMHLADQRGLLVLRSDLRAWGAEHEVWSPAPLIDRLIREGRRLSDMDAADLV